MKIYFSHQFLLKSKAPPYSPHRNDPHVGDNIGMLITDNSTKKSVFYAPGLGDIDEGVIEVMKQANCLLVMVPVGQMRK